MLCQNSTRSSSLTHIIRTTWRIDQTNAVLDFIFTTKSTKIRPKSTFKGPYLSVWTQKESNVQTKTTSSRICIRTSNPRTRPIWIQIKPRAATDPRWHLPTCNLLIMPAKITPKKALVQIKSRTIWVFKRKVTFKIWQIQIFSVDREEASRKLDTAIHSKCKTNCHLEVCIDRLIRGTNSTKANIRRAKCTFQPKKLPTQIFHRSGFPTNYLNLPKDSKPKICRIKAMRCKDWFRKEWGTSNKRRISLSKLRGQAYSLRRIAFRSREFSLDKNRILFKIVTR